MYRDILYVVRYRKSEYTVVVMTRTISVVKQPFITVIERLCNRNGTSIEVSRKLCSSMLNFHRKAPILVSQRDGLVLSMTHALGNEACILFNAHAVSGLRAVDKDKTKICYQESSIIVNVSIKVLQEQMVRASVIRKFFYSDRDVIGNYLNKWLV